MKLLNWARVAVAATLLSAGIASANRMAAGAAHSHDGFGHGFEHEHHEHHGWHHHGGVVILAPILFAPAFDDPFYRPPRVAEPPPVYIERGDSADALADGGVPSAAPPDNSDAWYFCAAAGMYYPYVTGCPSGWTRVPKP